MLLKKMNKFNKIIDNLLLLFDDCQGFVALLLWSASAKVLFGNIKLLNYVWLLKLLKL